MEQDSLDFFPCWSGMAGADSGHSRHLCEGEVWGMSIKSTWGDRNGRKEENSEKLLGRGGKELKSHQSFPGYDADYNGFP